MINMLIRWALYALIIVFIAYIIPGISVASFLSAMLVCLIIGLINIFIRPLIEFISLPINFLTLGLFSLVINAGLLWLAGYVTPGFEVNGFLSALLGSIILSVLATVIDSRLS